MSALSGLSNHDCERRRCGLVRGFLGVLFGLLFGSLLGVEAFVIVSSP